jgi:hypothetical protein
MSVQDRFIVEDGLRFDERGLHVWIRTQPVNIIGRRW